MEIRSTRFTFLKIFFADTARRTRIIIATTVNRYRTKHCNATVQTMQTETDRRAHNWFKIFSFYIQCNAWYETSFYRYFLGNVFYVRSLWSMHRKPHQNPELTQLDPQSLPSPQLPYA